MYQEILFVKTPPRLSIEMGQKITLVTVISSIHV